MSKTIHILVFLFTLFVACPPALADGFPRAASLKREEVNVRSGPGTRYPILWVFHRQGWPVSLIAEYQNWYKIRDFEGEEGWVYRGLVSAQKTAVVSDGPPLILYRNADAKRPLFRLEPQVVVYIEACGDLMCKITKDKHKGWVSRLRLLSVASE